MIINLTFGESNCDLDRATSEGEKLKVKMVGCKMSEITVSGYSRTFSLHCHLELVCESVLIIDFRWLLTSVADVYFPVCLGLLNL